MPINLNLWSLMLLHWLNPSGGGNESARHGQSHGTQDDLLGADKWRNRPPPFNLARLSPHLRRDIGLDCDRI